MSGTLRRPKALLLDFGGVIVAAPTLPPAPVELTTRIHRLIDGVLPRERIERDLIEGARAYSRWRDDVSIQGKPSELAHAQVFDNFITPTWPDTARERVRHETADLCYAWTYRPGWEVLPGIHELLDAAESAGIPCAIVSNTLCGAAHRDFLTRIGLDDKFAIQIYSDELGIRKPNPEMAWITARELGVPIEDCWFIGDSLSRDIACARRAGCGSAILVHSARANREVTRETDPDVKLRDSRELYWVFTGELHR